MKLWIASDNTHGTMYDADEFFTNDGKKADPISIAYKYGRAETGEIIHIWLSDDTSVIPDYKVYWDNKRGEYLEY